MTVKCTVEFLISGVKEVVLLVVLLWSLIADVMKELLKCFEAHGYIIYTLKTQLATNSDFNFLNCM